MQTSRIFLYSSLFTIFLILPGYGQISSWTDKNGVRHFSNVETSEEKKTVEVLEEYETKASDEEVDRNRDRFQILRMYEEDREEKEKQKALEKEMREAEEREKKQQEAEARVAREKREACAERKKKLNDLRHTKWENYDAPGLYQIVCPDRRWKGPHGKVFNNMRDCTERRDKARKSAYEQAIHLQEKEVEEFCSR